jgi:tRNA(Ile)-lysidine synthase
MADWTLLHAKLHGVLRLRQLLPKNRRLLVAVSGGQDSLCLMRLLVDLQPKWGWELAIAHCNHRWRSDEAENVAYVAEVAAAWDVPFFCETAIEVPIGEAAARAWRYGALARIAIAQGYEIVVTGHTKSDRAETTLYNLIRGSGADGLQALSWERALVSGVQLVRPLLEITRAETGEFCQSQQIKIWEDVTNLDVHYARNRIRQELIPYLQTHFNPQVEQALAQMAELLTADVDYLEQAAAELLRAALQIPQGSVSSELGLNRVMLRSTPLALQRRVIRQFLQSLAITPSFEQVENLVGLLDAPNRSQGIPLPGGAIARVEGDWIRMERQKPRNPT